MKIFLGILVVVAVGLVGWAIWAANHSTNLALQTSPSETDIYSVPTETPVPETSEEMTETPMETIIPTPTPPVGQGGLGTPPPRTPVFATMSMMNNSDLSGVAALTANDNDLAMISFNMIGETENMTDPAYIYSGTCLDLGTSLYELSPLVNGSSTTTLSANFLDFLNSSDHLSVVVYSGNGQPTIFSCGQLE